MGSRERYYWRDVMGKREPDRGQGASSWVTGADGEGVVFGRQPRFGEPGFYIEPKPWADKYGQDFFDWYESASVEDRKDYQRALLTWTSMPGQEATVGWCRRYDREHGGYLGIMPMGDEEQAETAGKERERLWSLIERYAEAYAMADICNIAGNGLDYEQARKDERVARRELRAALGFEDVD